MGDYTAVYFNATLKAGLKPSTVQFLCDMIRGQGPFEEGRSLCHKQSNYTSCEAGYFVHSYNEDTDQVSLIFHGDLKNYESEIDNFMKFVMPFVDLGDADELKIGWKQFEGWDEPKEFFVVRGEALELELRE